MWNYKTPGIPDKEFERTDEVPITKEEVRTLQISKARLRTGSLVYDVGCGSGSISVEAALQIESEGKVFAIDKDPNAIELTKKNLERFGINNVSVILGNAKEKISELPEADAIFIGGTGGDTKDIVELSQDKLKSGIFLMLSTFGLWTSSVKIDQIEQNRLIKRLRSDLVRLKLTKFEQLDASKFILIFSS